MTRNEKEMVSLFKDPKFSRQAWRSVGMAILQNPAKKAPEQYDKDGNPTLQSEIERYSWNKLHADLQILGEKDRGPTELEMIMQCQIMRARFDTSAAIFVRDTLGAKPVDESKVDAQLSNPYEQLSDEELELIAEARQKKALEAQHVAEDITVASVGVDQAQ
jgi:hypothetical protein